MIELLRTVFARNGLPEQIVSDNGPQFTSSKFENFMKENGITHFRSAPYHPATNGLAEPICEDMIRLDVGRTVQDKRMRQATTNKKAVMRFFEIVQSVLAKDYRGQDKWVEAEINAQLGLLTYGIKTKAGNYWRHHVHQRKETLRKNSPTEECTPFCVSKEIHYEQYEDNLFFPSPITSTDDSSEPSQITELEKRSSPYPRRECKCPECGILNSFNLTIDINLCCFILQIH